MADIGFGVGWSEYAFADSQFTYNLAAGITKSDEGKAVSLDTSADGTVKLAADGDVVIGRLEVVEDRLQAGTLIGTVAHRFCGALPIKAAQVVNVGDAIQGAGAGEIKTLPPYVDTGGTGNPVVTAASHNQKSHVNAVSGSTAYVMFNV